MRPQTLSAKLFHFFGLAALLSPVLAEQIFDITGNIQ
jgi:hypothetical protein